ncbi:MAG: hypothetical protein KDA73_18540 [Rhodobacteraceae bacterium]|nr:hypothetical protein [Paracoccaceae bacterium]
MMPDGAERLWSAARNSARKPAAIRLAPVLACIAFGFALSVYLANGAPLYYFDTASYLGQGHSMLDAIGFHDRAPAAVPAAGPSPDATDASGGPTDETVDTSRSAAYALGLAILDAIAPIDLTVLANLALVWTATVLVTRQLGPPGETTRLAAIGLIAGTLGALPFYVAFLMPDIFTPVLLLMLALLCTYGPGLDRWELGLATALALAAVLAHPSHLLTAALVMPVGFLISPAFRRRRLILPLALICIIVGGGVAERLGFAAAVEQVEGRDAQALPFLTARLIDDGPGYAYLLRKCPDPEIATCALLAPLSRSDNPLRLGAPHILFSTQPDTGSLKLLSTAEQRAIAAEQMAFVQDVIRSAPLAVVAAAVRNTLTQLAYVGVDMTVPPPPRLADLKDAYGDDAASLRDGRLVAADRAWLAVLRPIHEAVYVASALLLAGLLLFPSRLPPGGRTFIVVTFVGLLIHAAVCGGVSVPADRYGARAALTLPILAAIFGTIALWRRQEGSPSPAVVLGAASPDRSASTGRQSA